MTLKMEPSNSSLQQLFGRGMSLWKKIQGDPKVALVMSSRVYVYLSSHPFAAFSVLIFIALASVPFGVFLSFALIVTIISALGFVFFEGFLLICGGLMLLFVLSGIAFFSLIATLVVGTFYVTSSIIVGGFIRKRNKESPAEKKQSGDEPSTEADPSKDPPAEKLSDGELLEEDISSDTVNLQRSERDANGFIM